MPVWTDPSLSRSSKVHFLLDWWSTARGAGDLPDRRDLDPVALKPLMPWLLIAEATRPPFKIRYRLVGTGVAQYSGFDFTGGYLDELWPGEAAKRFTGYYQQVHDSRAPLFGSATEPTTAGTEFTYEFAILPLTRGGTAVEQFVCVEDYFGFQPVSAQWSRGRLAESGLPYVLG